jgi:hypothetical protein
MAAPNASPVGSQFVGWMIPNCQRELFVIVLPDNNGHGSMAEHACAVLAGSLARAVAICNPAEDDVLDERFERNCETYNVPLMVGGK